MKLKAALALAAGLAACHAALPGMNLIPENAPQGPIRVVTQAVPLSPGNPAQDAVGAFRYAGGIAISSPSTSRLHGQSDLVIDADGLGLHSQGDEGDRFDARIVLDRQDRLVGLTDARIGRLTGLDGAPLRSKREADSEGIALLPDGSRLVSFERHDRIWLYQADGGRPRPAPFPPGVAFPDNEGLEALAYFPAAGADAYLAGAEDDGHVWVCHLHGVCADFAHLPPPPAYGLAAITVAPSPGPPLLAIIHRAWDPVTGSRARISLVRLDGPLNQDVQPHTVASFDLGAPLTIDNFEGVAVVPRPGGGLRLYLISDDNFNPGQRTLLLAFDYTPAQERQTP